MKLAPLLAALTAVCSTHSALAEGPTLSAAAFGGAAEHDLAYGGFDVQLGLGESFVGLEVHGASVRDAYVAGLQREDGLRLRLRAPLQLALATANGTWAARRGLDLFLVIAPQVRFLDVGGRRATSIGGDVGLAAHVWLLDRIALDVGLSLPLLIDVSGPASGEFARFPGGTFALGATLRATERLALSAVGRVVITEGYGGDSEKQSLEVQLGLRFFFGDDGRGSDPLLGQTL